jgi:hypothetical protein
MSQIAQQMITPTFADPKHVSETWVDGPMNGNILGPCLTITFTVTRPDLDQIMKGKPVTKLTAEVANRVTMPLHLALQLRATLNTIVQDQPPFVGTTSPGTPRTQ